MYGYNQAVDLHSNICTYIPYLIISFRVIQGNSQENRMALQALNEQLTAAAKNDEVDALQQLITNGANVNYKTEDFWVSIYT